ncbi:25S rRNA (uridine-N(3))-methyltransferase [Hypsizygus marmoreus]|uniref:25S rRNA (Uridine-N(3))-methyltransferase n=1 Tax=Hypsizygus marmoreus TaxID=39966 RepID=A0A369KC15_HYPMA|nr:25S rRNA (uridine-N(3))-methyltransferase [Hypsizygus marmoreus]
MGKSKNLKAALQSQQSRLKSKQKLSHAAQVAEQRGQKIAKQQQSSSSSSLKGKGKGKAVAAPLPRRTTIPFHATDTILLIGEGNFSFAHALITEPHELPPKNLTATAYDSEEQCYAKYADAQAIVEGLRERGVQVLFSVDATRLERTPGLKGRRWDRVVWNFPHAGKGITDQDRNILSNQMLILGFLRSAAKVLSLGPVPSFTNSRKKKKNDDDDEEEADMPVVQEENADDGEYEFFVPEETVKTRGTVLVTLRNVTPYTLWDVPRLAKKPPLPTSGSTPPNPRFTLLRSFAFIRSAYKGYEHRMTKGTRAHGTGRTGEGGEDRTWEFCLQDIDSNE